MRFWYFFLFFSIASFTAQYFCGAYTTDRGNYADEAAHFVSSLTIAEYISDGHFSNPVSFAKNYYNHFPKVAIGHWPPVFELSQALIFAIFGGSDKVAMVFQGIISGLCIAIPATIIAGFLGSSLGVVSGFIILLSPLYLTLINLDMADVLLGIFVTLAALCWGKFYEVRSWKCSLAFVCAASAAILTKGSALGLAFLPLIHLALKRDLVFLFNKKVIIAAIFTAMMIVPWYALTYQMAADGFVYKWGWNYTHIAAPFFLGQLFVVLGLPAALLYFIGLYYAFKDPLFLAPKSFDVTPFASASVAFVIFLLLAPADIEPRYLMPIFPLMAIVAVHGAYRFFETITPNIKARTTLPIIISLLLVFSVATVFAKPQIRSLSTGILVKDIMNESKPNPLILISGDVNEEGAFIASFAQQDKASHYYIIRAQKALAHTDWMGTFYDLKFTTSDELAAWINRSGIGWIVLSTDTVGKEFPHSALLRESISSGVIPAHLVDTVFHEDGKTELYVLPAADTKPIISDELLSIMAPGHLSGSLMTSPQTLQ